MTSRRQHLQAGRARPGSCAIAAIVLAGLLAGLLTLFGGSLFAIGFMMLDDWAGLTADEYLARGGPGGVLERPIPRLENMPVADPPLSEKPYRFAAGPLPRDGWERVYRSRLAAGGQLTVRLDGTRNRVREVVLPAPAKPFTWEGQAARRAWGPPASTTDDGDSHVSRWRFPVKGQAATIEAVVRWHGQRPGVLDEVRWTRSEAPSGTLKPSPPGG